MQLLIIILLLGLSHSFVGGQGPPGHQQRPRPPGPNQPGPQPPGARPPGPQPPGARPPGPQPPGARPPGPQPPGPQPPGPQPPGPQNPPAGPVGPPPIEPPPAEPPQVGPSQPKNIEPVAFPETIIEPDVDNSIVEEPRQNNQPLKGNNEQATLDAVNELAAEIVEAIVERVEEDEAMAIEMEKNGIDPDVDSAANFLVFQNSLYLRFVSIIILIVNL